VYYRLVGAYEYDKTEAGYKRLIKVFNKARRAGRIPFRYIRDGGVTRSYPPGFTSIEAAREAFEEIIRHGVINKQTVQPIKQIVVCEAAGMVPQLASRADRYGVEVVSAGGFNSSTNKHDMAQEVAAEDKPVLVHHLGDYDPSGVHVFQSLAEDVEAFVDSLGGRGIFRRLVVTPEQIEAMALPMAPTKAGDVRVFDGTGTVQAEAIPPDTLGQILNDALAEFFDFEADDAAQAKSDADAATLRDEFGFDT